MGDGSHIFEVFAKACCLRHYKSCQFTTRQLDQMVVFIMGIFLTPSHDHRLSNIVNYSQVNSFSQ